MKKWLVLWLFLSSAIFAAAQTADVCPYFSADGVTACRIILVNPNVVTASVELDFYTFAGDGPIREILSLPSMTAFDRYTVMRDMEGFIVIQSDIAIHWTVWNDVNGTGIPIVYSGQTK